MKIETLAHVKNQFSAVVESLGAEPLFITRKGKVAAVLHSITDDEVEDYLLRNSVRFWRLMEERRSRARQGGILLFDPSRYQTNDTESASVRTVREKRAEYKARKKPKP